MIHSDYYQNYKGPELTLAQIWTHETKKEDITEYIRNFYGEKNNWNSKLYNYKDIFPNKTGHKFYVEFHSHDGRKHWFYGLVGGQSQFFNPPLSTPMDQN